MSLFAVHDESKCHELSKTDASGDAKTPETASLSGSEDGDEDVLAPQSLRLLQGCHVCGTACEQFATSFVSPSSIARGWMACADPACVERVREAYADACVNQTFVPVQALPRSWTNAKVRFYRQRTGAVEEGRVDGLSICIPCGLSVINVGSGDVLCLSVAFYRFGSRMEKRVPLSNIIEHTGAPFTDVPEIVLPSVFTESSRAELHARVRRVWPVAHD